VYRHVALQLTPKIDLRCETIDFMPFKHILTRC
jgi:hypothetical protein